MSRKIDLKKQCGVYRINFPSGHFYIGATSLNFYKRFGDHLRDLEGGTHSNKFMQNVYNKYGAPKLHIIEVTTPSKAFDIEQLHLDYYFNIHDRSGGTSMLINLSRSATSGAKSMPKPEKPEVVDIVEDNDASPEEEMVADRVWLRFPDGKMRVYPCISAAYAAYNEYSDDNLAKDLFVKMVNGLKAFPSRRNFDGGLIHQDVSN